MMASPIEFHEFDGSGDVLLLLTYCPEVYEDTDLFVSEDDEMEQEAGTTDAVVRKDDNTAAPEPLTDVHMLVASKSLMLASPVFKAMLQKDTFKEGRELHSTGKVYKTSSSPA
jgi:RecG-like helicase